MKCEICGEQQAVKDKKVCQGCYDNLSKPFDNVVELVDYLIMKVKSDHEFRVDNHGALGIWLGERYAATFNTLFGGYIKIPDYPQAGRKIPRKKAKELKKAIKARLIREERNLLFNAGVKK